MKNTTTIIDEMEYFEAFYAWKKAKSDGKMVKVDYLETLLHSEKGWLFWNLMSDQEKLSVASNENYSEWVKFSDDKWLAKKYLAKEQGVLLAGEMLMGQIRSEIKEVVGDNEWKSMSDSERNNLFSGYFKVKFNTTPDTLIKSLMGGLNE